MFVAPRSHRPGMKHFPAAIMHVPCHNVIELIATKSKFVKTDDTCLEWAKKTWERRGSFAGSVAELASSKFRREKVGCMCCNSGVLAMPRVAGF